MKIPCSVGVLTCNNALTLERALESVKDFDDLIVLDGGSTDATLDIARRFNARVLEQDRTYTNAEGRITDFAAVRNQHLAAAKHKWFLYIDSDEFLSQEAAEEIRAIVARPRSDRDPLIYDVPRKTVVDGICIDCATAYPSYQKRFFNLDGVTGFIKPVHERINPKPGVVVAKLVHPEYVPLDLTRTEFYAKQRRYLAIEVERHKNDTRTEWLRGVVWGSLRSTLSYLYRHAKLILFCRGTKMPLWVEWMHHWYNWKLVTLTGAKYFRRDPQ